MPLRENYGDEWIDPGYWSFLERFGRLIFENRRKVCVWAWHVALVERVARRRSP